MPVHQAFGNGSLGFPIARLTVQSKLAPTGNTAYA